MKLCNADINQTVSVDIIAAWIKWLIFSFVQQFSVWSNEMMSVVPEAGICGM